MFSLNFHEGYQNEHLEKAGGDHERNVMIINEEDNSPRVNYNNVSAQIFQQLLLLKLKNSVWVGLDYFIP